MLGSRTNKGRGISFVWFDSVDVVACAYQAIESCVTWFVREIALSQSKVIGVDIKSFEIFEVFLYTQQIHQLF